MQPMRLKLEPTVCNVRLVPPAPSIACPSTPTARRGIFRSPNPTWIQFRSAVALLRSLAQLRPHRNAKPRHLHLAFGRPCS